MTCRTFTAGGITVIACTRGERRPSCSSPNCGRVATIQCDYIVAGGKTCDRHLCAAHATKPPNTKNIDYCGPHARAHERSLAP